jgi:hypothetical protein
MIVINESGLYSLILRSDKPQAKKFKKWVTSEVLPSIRRTGGYAGGVPAFIRRFNHNWDRIDVGHFSVLSKLVVRLWGRLEQVGCRMKDQSATGIELRPDVSVGLRFSKWLKNFIRPSRLDIRNTCIGRRREISQLGNTPTTYGRFLLNTLIQYGCRNAVLNTSKRATHRLWHIFQNCCRHQQEKLLETVEKPRSGGVSIYQLATDHLASLAPRQVRARHPACACSGSAKAGPSHHRRVHRSCGHSLCTLPISPNAPLRQVFF